MAQIGLEPIHAASIVAAGITFAAARCSVSARIRARTPRGSPSFLLCGSNRTRTYPRSLNRRIAPLERSHCSFRLTRSGRFLLRRIAHWATASLAPSGTRSVINRVLEPQTTKNEVTRPRFCCVAQIGLEPMTLRV